MSIHTTTAMSGLISEVNALEVTAARLQARAEKAELKLKDELGGQESQQAVMKLIKDYNKYTIAEVMQDTVKERIPDDNLYVATQFFISVLKENGKMRQAIKDRDIEARTFLENICRALFGKGVVMSSVKLLNAAQKIRDRSAKKDEKIKQLERDVAYGMEMQECLLGSVDEAEAKATKATAEKRAYMRIVKKRMLTFPRVEPESKLLQQINADFKAWQAKRRKK